MKGREAVQMRQSCSDFRKRSERGMTLLESVIVLAVVLITSAMVIINSRTAMRSARITQSAIDYANLLQQARIRAVQNDQFYIVRTIAANGAIPAQAFVDIQGTGIFAAGDPLMAFAGGVVPMPAASAPGVANLIGQFLPAGQAPTINANAPGPTFGPRGLPCRTVINAGFTTCPALAQPTSYITFVQNQQGGKWGAITVTPAGRIRIWGYDGNAWAPKN